MTIDVLKEMLKYGKVNTEWGAWTVTEKRIAALTDAIERLERIDKAIEMLNHPRQSNGHILWCTTAGEVITILSGKTSTQKMLDEVIDHIMEV
jgi:hypothetical protein